MIKTIAKHKDETLYLHWDGKHVYLKYKDGLDIARFTLEELNKGPE